MKAKHLLYIAALIFVLPLQSCFINEDKHIVNDAKGNFEMLWKICDEYYCYFDYKNIDWDSIHTVYEPRVYNGMSDQELFKVCSDMLAELKDGHVNLYYEYDRSKYWKWFEEYPQNYDERIILENYFNFDYHRKGGLTYQMLPENIGYIHYDSFTSDVPDYLLNYILTMFKDCKGLIIDIRNNGGGSVANVNRLGCRLTKETRVHTGYKLYKTGPGHNDFADTVPCYLSAPGAIMSIDEVTDTEELNNYDSKRVRFLKPVAVLTNREVYSAANDFILNVKELDNVTIIGDRTGGGAGLPINFDLPNGWYVRLSTNPTIDLNKQHVDYGIDPDIKVDMAEDAHITGKDAILDCAIDYLLQQ